jgi:hypothetical protein
MDQAASSYQSLLRYLGERCQNPALDRGVGLRARCHRQETPQPHCLTLRTATNLEPHHVRTNTLASATYPRTARSQFDRKRQPTKTIRVLPDATESSLTSD